MQLSPHFSLAELVASTIAQTRGIDNTPPPEVLPRLQATADMLERIRQQIGAPIVVTSGYRCQVLNKAVGGVTSSDHVTGQAADIVVPQYGTPLQVARALAPLVSVLGIGQLIYERVGGKQWVHVSTRVPAQAANRVITVSGAGAQLGIQP
ncbi:MAG: peptidase M15A [Burkholderiaceae bacterium]|nr:MAG: peptidase M15A [Burkholderiaceae bacterium]